MKQIILLASLFLHCAVYSQDKAAKLDSLFQKLARENRFNGNVLVAENGKILYDQSFGMANQEKKLALNKETIFELASVSKQFTAMGIMILKKKGLISYEDSLRRFYPELPYPGITIRQLLNHTSGLPDYMEVFQEHGDSNKIATNEDMIALLARVKPAAMFNPGEKYEYSNTGYALLASIIEKASGMTYNRFLEKEIFKPLKMSQSLVFNRRWENRTIPNYAYGYVKKSDSLYVLPDEHPDFSGFVKALDGIRGDGAVNSTTGDLFLWDQALYTQKLLSKTEWEEALLQPVTRNGKKSYYGFGWMIDSSKTFGRIMNHSGGWPGYRTFMERHIDNGKTIILLTNMEKGNLPFVPIRSILYNLAEQKSAASIKISPDTLKQYAGKYQLAPEFIITVWVEKETLTAQATGQSSFSMHAEKTDWFNIPVVNARIQFKRNAAGAVQSMVLYQNGQEVPGEKIE